MTTSPLPDDVRDLLAAVLEAIDLPHPATHAGAEVHDRLLATRVIQARIALRAALGNDALSLGPAWDAQYLREQLARHPVTGYVTAEQAQVALDEGKTWSEAVALPTGEGQ
ncbi:hypothetical protein [Streptomyces chartreusis]|uniref:hypothetical protein n=1 Tax=Streptomyces chartreusis TaxID=1969 RepID=UPI0038070552